MLSDDETIAHMEATLKKAKANKVAKAEWRVAEEGWIAEAKAAEEHHVAEVRAAKERQIAEAKAADECHVAEVRVAEERWIAEEERSRAQAEALRQQKLLAALEAKREAKEVAFGSGLGPKGGLKDVGAPEKGKGVERTSCNHCTAQGVVCKVSPLSRVLI